MAAAFALLAASARAQGDHFEALLALGTLRRSQGKSSEADAALTKALELRPGDPGAEREMAMVDWDLGRDEAAAGLFEKLIRSNPKDVELYRLLARSDTRLGRFAAAKEAFAQAKTIMGSRAVGDYVAWGYFHLDAGDAEQARTDFETAIAVDTASPFGYHHLGVYFATHGQYPAAEKYFRQALERLEANPNTKTEDLLHTLTFLGNAIQLQGREPEAEAVFHKCLDKGAANVIYIKCLMALGQLYVLQNKKAEAEDVFQRTEAICKDGPPCECRGRVLIDWANFRLAQDRRSEAAALAAEADASCAVNRSYFVLLDLAGLFARLGDAARAEALYGRILSAGASMPMDDFIPMAARRLADLRMTQGRFGEAEKLYRQASGVFMLRHGEEAAVALDGLAAACEKQGKAREAAEAREKSSAVRVSLPKTSLSVPAVVPGVPGVSKDWRTLGERRRAEGNLFEAAGALKKALVSDSNDLKTERELAMVDQELNQDEEAAALLEKLIGQNQRDYDLYVRLARSDARLGRVAQAKEAFAQAGKLRKLSLDAYIEEGYFHLNIGEVAQAQEAFENAVAADTMSPVGYHYMGAYLAARERYPEAETYFRRALDRLKADPGAKADDPLHALDWLGTAVLQEGRDKEAERIYRNCLRHPAPGGFSPDYFRALSRVYSPQNKNARIEDVFKGAVDLCGAKPACSCRGRALIDLGNFYLTRGRGREAAAAADRADALCAAGPSDPAVLAGLADFYAGSGDAAKSEALYVRLLDSPRSPEQAATALDRLAAVYEKEGKRREASEALERAAVIRKP